LAGSGGGAFYMSSLPLVVCITESQMRMREELDRASLRVLSILKQYSSDQSCLRMLAVYYADTESLT
jgi:hypothetical protein